MVQVLIGGTFETKDFMHRIVAITTDSGTPDRSGFGFQLEHLPDCTCLPEQTGVEPSAVVIQRTLKLRHHPKTETPITCNVLGAGDGLRGAPSI